MPARDLRDEHALPPEAQLQPEAIQTVGEGLLVPEARLQRVAVEIVLADFEAAKTAREARDYGYSAKGAQLRFDQWLKELKDLYFGRREPKTVPWQYCSNRSLMIAMSILEVLHARILPAVYNEELTRFRPVEAIDRDRAEHIERFMFWWIRVQVKLREFFDVWVRATIAFGSTVTYSSWDEQWIDTGGLREAQPTVNPDGTVTIVPPEKVLEHRERSKSEVLPLEDVYFQPGATDIQRDTVVIKRRALYRDLEDLERQGKLCNISQPTVEGLLPLQERVMPSGAVVEGVTSDEQAELLNIRRRNLPIEVLHYFGTIDIDGDGLGEPVQLFVVAEHRLYIGGWKVSDTSRRGLRHLEVTKFIPRLDEPQSLYGLGVLEQVKELALEIDAIFNQMTDANTLGVLRPGFYDPSGDLEPTALNLSPNKMTPVTRPRDNLFFPDVNIPTERLVIAVRTVLEFIERLTAASSYIMGKESEIVGGSGTATRVEAIVSASNQRHAIPVQTLRMGAARIITHHLDLVQTNLTPGMEQRAFSDGGDPLFAKTPLTQESVAGEMDAYLLPDESMGSKESERQLAQLLYSILLQNPLVATNPAHLYTVTADVVKSWGKDVTAYLGPAPDQAASNRPEDEHALMLSGQVSAVRAAVGQNHLEHMLAHQQFATDPALQTLQPDARMQLLAFLQGHLQDHVAHMQLEIQLASRLNRKGGGGYATQSNGAPGGAASPTGPVGPEPGVGAVQSPRAQAGSLQRTGESQRPA